MSVLVSPCWPGIDEQSNGFISILLHVFSQRLAFELTWLKYVSTQTQYVGTCCFEWFLSDTMFLVETLSNDKQPDVNMILFYSSIKVVQQLGHNVLL